MKIKGDTIKDNKRLLSGRLYRIDISRTAYRLFDIKHPRAVPPVFIVYDQCQDIRPFTAMILYKGRFVFVSIDSVLTVVNMKIDMKSDHNLSGRV